MTNATSYLTNRNTPYRLFQHSTRPTSLAQAAEERTQKLEQVVRSILFRVSDDNFVMVLMPGPDQIPWKALRSYLGTRRITLATPEEVLSSTGFGIGTVSPFGVLKPVRIIIEKSLLQQQEISVGSGRHGLAIILQVSDLLSALPDSEIVDLLSNNIS